MANTASGFFRMNGLDENGGGEAFYNSTLRGVRGRWEGGKKASIVGQKGGRGIPRGEIGLLQDYPALGCKEKRGSPGEKSFVGSKGKCDEDIGEEGLLEKRTIPEKGVGWGNAGKWAEIKKIAVYTGWVKKRV